MGQQGHGGHGIWGHFLRLGGHPPSSVLAAFLLHNISPFIAIIFSIRQGDPLVALLFVLYLEPFLVRLEASF
jgi:hypothetical protein